MLGGHHPKDLAHHLNANSISPPLLTLHNATIAVFLEDQVDSSVGTVSTDAGDRVALAAVRLGNQRLELPP
jgi:hypothetical protein